VNKKGVDQRNGSSKGASHLSGKCVFTHVDGAPNSTIELRCNDPPLSYLLYFNHEQIQTQKKRRDEMSVMLETSLGDLIIDLETERCPRTCENFLKLCKMKYYALNAFFNGTF